ncbi:hypothetical protein [Escherichia fergusonii]|uniref:hypothetical protein n=1 Tax=Escherichia fergusonii TaxID=564 RepID=UPI00159BCDAE|nr:hypothetical protein [Escherichia fergusonii]
MKRHSRNYREKDIYAWTVVKLLLAMIQTRWRTMQQVLRYFLTKTMNLYGG